MSLALERKTSTGIDRASLRDGVVRFLPYAVILLLALIVSYLIGGICDVSWQITLSEKMLDGQRLYVDLLEVNPPASTFLYLPAVALARLLRLSPELVVDLQTLIAACASLFVASRIAPQIEIDKRAAAIVVFAILVLLPLRTFAQREHFALIAMLPLIAAAAVRAAGGTPLRWQSIAAGFCAGVIVSIKPHFALSIVLVYAVAAFKARSIKPLFALENWIGAAIALLYAAVVVIFFPAFLNDMMPLLADLYLPARLSLTNVALIAPILLGLTAFAVAVALDPPAARTIPFLLLAAASIGFGIAYLIQGKAWPYQALPMLALTVMAFALVFLRTRQASAVKRIVSTAGLMAVTFATSMWLQIGIDTRAVAAEVRRVSHQPSVVVISGDIAHGHPLVREVKGRWISAVCSLWISENAMLLEKAGWIAADARERIAAYVATDRARLIADIRDGKPDIVLVNEADAVWKKWASADSDVQRELANYARLKTVDGLTIYKRRG